MGDVDADRARRFFRSVQRAQRAAGRALIEIERQPGAEHQHKTGKRIPEFGVRQVDADSLQHRAKPEFEHRHAVRSARQLCFVWEHHGDEDTETEAGDGKIIALEPQDRPTDKERDSRG